VSESGLAERHAAVVGGRGARQEYSEAARALLRDLPLTIDYTDTDRFAVYDKRKPPGQNQLFVAQTVGTPVPSVLYGLLSVMAEPDRSGKLKRTVVFSGAGSAGVQAAVEFFCSADRMRELKSRGDAVAIVISDQRMPGSPVSSSWSARGRSIPRRGGFC